MTENSISLYSSDIGERYLLTVTQRVASSTAKSRRRNIHILSDYLENVSIAKRIVHLVEYPLPGEIGKVSLVFLQSLTSLRRSESTVREHRRLLSYFISSMALKSKVGVNEIEEQDVLSFIGSAQCCKDGHYYTMRLFCRFLYEQKYIDRNLEYVLRRKRFPVREKLPSVYNPEKIRQIETSVELSSPVGKRDYAILLLASRLGLRASDICELKFSNVDWDENKIILTQYKTGRRIELPLLAPIGEAIVNYLKYARPVSGLPEIFLTAVAPYCPMTHIGLNSIITRIMRASGVDISQRRFGPHSMRHSLAGQLLKNGIPLPVISETLGHEVPIVNSKFYEQKGGVFYE
jgi:integrase